MKKCSSCKMFKFDYEFRYRSGNRSTQLRPECKSCEAVKQRIRMQDPERKRKASEYQKINNVKNAEKTQRWRDRHPDKAKESARRSSPQALRNWRAKGGPAVDRQKEATKLRQRGIRDKKSKEYYHIIKNDICSYCSNKFEHTDHIDPIIKNKSYKWFNLTSSCATCNTSKGSKSLLEFLLYKLEKGNI